MKNLKKVLAMVLAFACTFSMFAGAKVFEDVPAGIQAGKNAGMTVFAVEDAFSLEMKEEKEKLADYYIRDYYESLDGAAG